MEHSCKFSLVPAAVSLIDKFRYVAMHSMQHTSESSEAAHVDGAYDGGLLGPYASSRGSRKKDITDIALMVVGMLLPLLTQIGHAHAHGE